MKRLKFHRAIVAIAMMLIGWLPSLAHDFEVDGIYYNKTSDNTAAVTYKGYAYDSYSNEYAGDVVIPSSVDYNGATYSVTSIGDDAFYKCKSLKSIEIPNSVTSIGYYAFDDCESLTSVVIGNSVTSIGYSAFYNCSRLTSIEIPNSVTSIGYYAFAQCSSLTSIEIPNSVTSIGNYAFSGCSSLTSVEIGNSVTSIGERAFYDCSSLTSVIWNSVRCSDFYFDYTPFENCPNITSFTFGDEVEHIPAYLCYNLSKLTSIEIGNSVTSIGDYAFCDCSRLTSVEIGNSVTSIGERAFLWCTSLTSVVIGNSVTSIGYAAFYNCSRLTSIQIPNSVTSIGDYAFCDCSRLSKITCLATNPPTIKSYTFSNYSADLFVPAGCKESYEAAKYWNNFTNIIEVTLDAPVTLNDNNAIVATIGENIVVKNAMVGSVVRVYTADGAMIASEFATEGDVIIEAPAKGIYVVKVGKQTVKVII